MPRQCEVPLRIPRPRRTSSWRGLWSITRRILLLFRGPVRRSRLKSNFSGLVWLLREAKATEAEEATAEAGVRAAGAELQAAAETHAIRRSGSPRQTDGLLRPRDGSRRLNYRSSRGRAEASAAQARVEAAQVNADEAQATAAQATDELLRLHQTKLLRYVTAPRKSAVTRGVRREICDQSPDELGEVAAVPGEGAWAQVVQRYKNA